MYSWVSFCFCALFVLLFAMLLHHLLILEWMRQTAPSLSHIWEEKLPLGWHTWKHPSLGCLSKSTAEPQLWLLCHSKQFILSWKRDGRGMWRPTPFRTLLYQACERHEEASFGFPPHNLLPCTAWFTSVRYNLHTALSSMPHFTDASHIFRNWVLTTISMDLPLSAPFTWSWIKEEIFLEMYLTVFSCPGGTVLSDAPLHLFCVQAQRHWRTAAMTEVQRWRWNMVTSKFGITNSLLKLQRLLLVSV